MTYVAKSSGHFSVLSYVTSLQHPLTDHSPSNTPASTKPLCWFFSFLTNSFSLPFYSGPTLGWLHSLPKVSQGNLIQPHTLYHHLYAKDSIFLFPAPIFSWNFRVIYLSGYVTSLLTCVKNHNSHLLHLSKQNQHQLQFSIQKSRDHPSCLPFFILPLPIYQ